MRKLRKLLILPIVFTVLSAPVSHASSVDPEIKIVIVNPRTTLLSVGGIALAFGCVFSNTGHSPSDQNMGMMFMLFGAVVIAADGVGVSSSTTSDTTGKMRPGIKQVAQQFSSKILAESRAIASNAEVSKGLNIADLTTQMAFNHEVSSRDQELKVANLVADANSLTKNESQLPATVDEVEKLAKNLLIKEDLPIVGSNFNFAKNLIALFTIAHT